MQRGAQTHHLAIRGFGSPGTGVMKIAWEVRSGTDEIMGEWVSGEFRGEGLPFFIPPLYESAIRVLLGFHVSYSLLSALLLRIALPHPYLKTYSALVLEQ